MVSTVEKFHCKYSQDAFLKRFDVKEGIRKTPTRKIPTHQTTPWNIPTRKIPTWNFSTHVFKHSHPSFLIFCFFIIVTVIIDIT